MAETVAERVIRVFAEFKKVSTDEITLDTTFEELGFDSLDGLNLIFELEEEFDMTIPDNKVADMKGVRQAIEGIEMLLEAKAQGIDVNAAAAEDFAAEQAAFKAKKEADAAQTDDTSTKAETKKAETKKSEAKPAAKTKTADDKPVAKAKKADDKPAAVKAKKADTAPAKPKLKKKPTTEK